MTEILTLIMLVLAILSLLVLLPIVRRASAKPMRAFTATVTDKATETSILYTGIFIPMKLYYLVTEQGYRVKVEQHEHDRYSRGSTITVVEYSDGSYKLSAAK